MKGRLIPQTHGLGGARLLSASSASRSAKTLGRIGALLCLLVLLAVALNLGAASASFSGNRNGSVSNAVAAAPLKAEPPREEFSPARAYLSPAPVFQTSPVGIETYDCTTGLAQSVFELGDTVCARATGVPTALLFPWRVSWVVPAGLVVQTENALDDPLTPYDYPLPTGPVSSTIPVGDEDPISFKTRGTWRVNLTRVNGSIRATAFFTVRDPASPISDVHVQKFSRSATSPIGVGDPVAFLLIVGNDGPDAAQSVHLADAVPAGATLASFTQLSGPDCLPASPTAPLNDCTMASLGGRQRAEFSAIYDTDGATAGTVMTTASVSTTTTESDTDNNTAAVRFEITAGGGGEAACVLECPNDITVRADATDDPDGPGGNNPIPGAFVTFGAAEGFGDCGTINATPASGTFFPVGTWNVSVSSTSGGSCSFNVTVLMPSSLNITCPANIVTSIGAPGTTGCAVAVDPGSPTTDDPNATVVGVRSDNRGLDDPYPIGTTTITWTATDEQGETNSCRQTVTVNVGSGGLPGITAPPNVVAYTGQGNDACGVVVEETTLGEAESTGCSGAITRTGVPQDNLFPVGMTEVTWKVTDAAGNTATATQTVTVVDNTLPSVTAPAGTSVTADASCQMAVPNVIGPDTASDNCTPASSLNVTQSPAAGTLVGAGVHTITIKATDAAGNIGEATTTFEVIDQTPPTITAPADLSLQCVSEIPEADAAQATASDTCSTPEVTVSDVSNGGAGTPASPLVITRTYKATDAAGNAASDVQVITVKDTTAPTLNVPANIVVSNDADSCSAVVSFDVSVSDNCGTAEVSTTIPSGATFQKGTTTVTATATDAAGNVTTKNFTVTVNDTQAPSVTYPAAGVVQYVQPNSTATFATVTYSVTAADNCPGVTLDVSPPSGSTFNVGTTEVTATATDASGNVTTRKFNVTVLYHFTGFFSPISNTVMNLVNAGRTIPVKFSLSGNKGLNIFALGHPLSRQIPCGSESVNDVEAVEMTGNSSLSYDSAGDKYQFNWKTESSWAGQCRELVVKLSDGSEHTAPFKFR